MAHIGPRDASAALCNKGFACICLHINMQDLESLKKRLSVQLGWGVCKGAIPFLLGLRCARQSDFFPALCHHLDCNEAFGSVISQ